MNKYDDTSPTFARGWVHHQPRSSLEIGHPIVRTIEDKARPPRIEAAPQRPLCEDKEPIPAQPRLASEDPGPSHWSIVSLPILTMES